MREDRQTWQLLFLNILARLNTYQGCAYETGIFFVNINECCIKSIKVILFKVIYIISYTSLPPLWQFVDSSPKKILVLRGEPTLEPFFDIFEVGEPLLGQCISHRRK